MVNRVRDIILERDQDEEQDSEVRPELRLNFMSWNASSAALNEIIMYLEELVDLTKLLVGSSDFRSGMLFRPNYHAYIQEMEVEAREDLEDHPDDDDKNGGSYNTESRNVGLRSNVSKEKEAQKEETSDKISLSGSGLEQSDKMTDHQRIGRVPVAHTQSPSVKARSAQPNESDKQEINKATPTKEQHENIVEEQDEELNDLPLPLQRIATRARLERQISRSSLQSQGAR